MKNEIILVSPGPKGFSVRGMPLNEFSNAIVSKINKFFLKQRPKRRETPLNILSIGTALKNAGYIPRLIDGRHENIREKLKVYLNDKTLFVGISSMTSYQIVFGLKTAKIVRKVAPDLPIVWGGLHPTVLAEETLKTSDYVDIACKGEGEVTVVELADAIQKERPLENVAGISYKDEEGRVINNENRAFVDFDRLPHMDYSLLDPLVYDFSYITYQSSRGCPHRCKFCEVGPIHNRRYRSRSVQTIINDIENLIKSYSTKEICFIDENFFVNVKNAREFANSVIEKKLPFRWRAFCRADYFRRTDVDFWKLMKKAGGRIISIGGESGSQKTLDNMNKDYKVSDLINAATQLEEAGITNEFSFMCGLPDEEKTDMEKTIELVDHLRKNFKKLKIFEIFLFMPLLMTPYYDELRKRGCNFPNQLKDWGSFLFGGKEYTKWHPLHEYAFRLALVSKWIAKIPISRIFKPLIRLDIFLSLMYLCGYISYYRWRYKFFSFPIDIYIQYWLNRYIFKYLWQR